MSDEWRKTTLTSIYKTNEQIQNCTDYKGIKLKSRTNKLWERVIERRQRKETQGNDNQFNFMPERLTMEAIYLIQRIIERYQINKKDLQFIITEIFTFNLDLRFILFFNCLNQGIKNNGEKKRREIKRTYVSKLSHMVVQISFLYIKCKCCGGKCELQVQQKSRCYNK